MKRQRDDRQVQTGQVCVQCVRRQTGSRMFASLRTEN